MDSTEAVQNPTQQDEVAKLMAQARDETLRRHNRPPAKRSFSISVIDLFMNRHYQDGEAYVITNST